MYSIQGAILDRLLAANTRSLDEIFNIISGGTLLLTREQLLNFITDEGGLNTSMVDAIKCIALSKIPVVDEKITGHKSQMHFRFNFEEFLEILVRISLLRFKNAFRE